MPTLDADFRVEIREASVSGASSRESVIVREWSKRAFAGYDHAYWGQFEWAAAHWHVLGMLDGRPVSYAKLTRRNAMGDDRRVTVLARRC